MHLLPVDQSFYGDLERLSSRVVEAAGQVRDMTTDGGVIRTQRRAPIRAIEHDADEITLAFVHRLDKKFATPFDAEDLYTLALRLDSVIDLIAGLAWRFELFGIREMTPNASALASVLLRAAAAVDTAIKYLRDPRAVWEQTATIKRCEEEGDALYFAAVSALFDPAGPRVPVLDVIKWKELYSVLEHAIDECQACARVLESIAVKHS